MGNVALWVTVTAFALIGIMTAMFIALPVVARAKPVDERGFKDLIRQLGYMVFASGVTLVVVLVELTIFLGVMALINQIIGIKFW